MDYLVEAIRMAHPRFRWLNILLIVMSILIGSWLLATSDLVCAFHKPQGRGLHCVDVVSIRTFNRPVAVLPWDSYIVPFLLLVNLFFYIVT